LLYNLLFYLFDCYDTITIAFSVIFTITSQRQVFLYYNNDSNDSTRMQKVALKK